MERVSRRDLIIGTCAVLGSLPPAACGQRMSGEGNGTLPALASRAGTLTVGVDLTVNRLGLGTGRLGEWERGAGFFRRGGFQDAADARRLLRRAVELGVQFIDTADTYGRDYQIEPLIYQALHPYPSNLVIATKGGLVRSGDGFDRDASPAHLRAACEASLARLHLERIDLYQLHWVDPRVMRRDEQGFFYFVDRVGGTFRWKGENVSTTEVAGVIAGCPGVTDGAVHGVSVPGTGGRAAIAALVAGPDFDLGELRRALVVRLPDYARLLFLRIVTALELTGTFKLRKQDLALEGSDPERVSGALYVDDATRGEYVPLTAQLHDRLQTGTLPLYASGPVKERPLKIKRYFLRRP